jgi:hypothetical protein
MAAGCVDLQKAHSPDSGRRPCFPRSQVFLKQFTLRLGQVEQHPSNNALPPCKKGQESGRAPLGSVC